jgi:hypothetical protein
MDCAVNQRLNLSDRNCLNLCERYSEQGKSETQSSLVAIEPYSDHSGPFFDTVFVVSSDGLPMQIAEKVKQVTLM